MKRDKGGKLLDHKSVEPDTWKGKGKKRKSCSKLISADDEFSLKKVITELPALPAIELQLLPRFCYELFLRPVVARELFLYVAK